MKVHRIYEKYGICLKLVDILDAEFILELRTNEQRARYLSPTEKDVEKQRGWIQEYKKRESLGTDFYFIAFDDKGNSYGTVRIYNIDAYEFTFGSWIFKNSSPASLIINSWFIVAEIGFLELKMRKCKFDIKKANKRVLKFQRRFKSSLIEENDDTYFFELDFERFVVERDRILNIF